MASEGSVRGKEDEKGTMATIHVLNTGQKVETDLVTSILVSLQRHAVSIEAVCGGRARCGKCAIRIVAGGEYLTKKNEAEAVRLNAIEAGSDMRLACQTYTRGDLEIEIVNLPE